MAPGFMFTRCLTDSETAQLKREFPMDLPLPGYIPLLVYFAAQLKIPNGAEFQIAEYKRRIMNCICWHCLEMRKRDLNKLDIYDVWLRYMLYCNGQLQHYLN